MTRRYTPNFIARIRRVVDAWLPWVVLLLFCIVAYACDSFRWTL